MKHRSSLLDILRILAALWVLSYHWSGRGGFYPKLKNQYDVSWWPESLNDVSKTGYLGVDVFFILSGAVIAHSAMKSTPMKFAESRFLRLFPVYLIATTIAAIVAPSVTSGFTVNISEYLGNLSMFPFQVLGLKIIVGAAWTLTYEIGFYLILFLAITYYKIRRVDFGDVQMRHLLFILVIGLSIGSIFNFSSQTVTDIFGFGSYFVLGTCLSQLKTMNLFKKYFLILIISSFLSARELLGRVSGVENRYSFCSVFIILVIVIILLGDNKKISEFLRPMSKSLTILSLMTYPIYLFHETVGVSVIYMLNEIGIGIQLCYLITLIALFVVSWVSVNYYEPRFKKVFNRVIHS